MAECVSIDKIVDLQALQISRLKAEIERLKAVGYVDIVFDGPPSHESGRFIEVEDENRASISIGDWVQRDDGYWVLRIRGINRLRAALSSKEPHLAAFVKDLEMERDAAIQRAEDFIAISAKTLAEVERLRDQVEKLQQEQDEINVALGPGSLQRISHADRVDAIRALRVAVERMQNVTFW